MGMLSALLGNAGVVDPAKLKKEYGNLFTQGEQIEVGFQLIRDVFLFTTKRLILIDKQGLTGRKISYQSIPYGNIARFSVETAGHFDLDAELKIWVGSDPTPIQKTFDRKVNIYDLQKVLALHILA